MSEHPVRFQAPAILVDALDRRRDTNIMVPKQRLSVGEGHYPEDVFIRLLALDMLYVFRQIP